MQVLAIFSVLLAVATSYPVVKTWTLIEMSGAIINPKTDPAMYPHLEVALSNIMYALFTGHNAELIKAVVPSPTGAATWTVEELTTAIADPATKPDYKDSLMQAYSYLKERNETGHIQDSVEVSVPAMDISIWTRSDLTEALQSPSTNPELIPYLEKAGIEFNQPLENGERRETVGIVTPVGLISPKADYEFKPKASKRFFKKTIKGLK